MSEEYEGYEGVLLKLGGGVIKRNQERWFELRKGTLYYYSSRPLGKVELAGAKVETNGNCSWKVEGPGMKHSYVFKAANEGEKAAWMARLQQAISNTADSRERTMSAMLPSGVSLTDSQSSDLCLNSQSSLAQTLSTNHNINPGNAESPESQPPLHLRIEELTRERDGLLKERERHMECEAKLRKELDAVKESRSAVSLEPAPEEGFETVEQMKKQLSFEREEQRMLRNDLCQEIDRLKEELISTHNRMQSAEEQAEDLLQRAIAASNACSTSQSASNFLNPCLSPGGSSSLTLLSSHLASEKPEKHVRSRSCDLTNGGLQTDVTEGELQSKLEKRMVQKYIELKKVLYDLQDVGVEKMEHVVTISRRTEDEKIGLSFKKPSNVIKSVTAGLSASLAGLKPGMQIVSVGGKPTPDHDAVLAQLLYKTQADIIVSENTSSVVARVEGNTLLAEERHAILLENDRLKEELASFR
eukprot:TRINITY_DN3571_c0_g4_i1.p1 TRINITY_DN3571_c0_g4~~TRINITY_DN3571_c0_g4_i1.p1  ORF type:complete len:472 (+),score=68.70 TRINITY_DN3571_c0_g4_i1:58-1473(+)